MNNSVDNAIRDNEQEVLIGGSGGNWKSDSRLLQKTTSRQKR